MNLLIAIVGLEGMRRGGDMMLNEAFKDNRVNLINLD
jgi:hypothetical protein